MKRSKKNIEDYAFHADMGTWYFVPDAIEQDRRAIKLFNEFNYDIRDPRHWRWLIDNFYDLHFGQKGRGRPTKWTKAAYSKMWFDLFWLKNEPGMGRNGIMQFTRKEIPRSPRAQAALLKKTHPDDPLYKNSSVDEIYKNLLKAIPMIEEEHAEEVFQSMAASMKETDPDADVDWLKPPPKKKRAIK